MEHHPDEGVSSMQGESYPMGEWWDENGKEDVDDQEDELEISRSMPIKPSARRQIWRQQVHSMGRKTYRNGSRLWSSTTSLRK